NKEWLGREVDKDLINELVELEKKFSISPAGEGGEIETSVLDAPFFKKKIRILEYEIVAEEHSGLFLIRKAELVDK
ncbi:MAG TPA: TIGR00289 family protein, partial [Candidatus Woesearchaeota archaeon]|nr:TIGR00289 family protein [Candidatus Woesearchaeota archaeon]